MNRFFYSNTSTDEISFATVSKDSVSFSLAQIEQVARSLRVDLGLDDLRLFDVLRVIEIDLAKFVNDLSFVVVDDKELDDGVLALTTHDPLSIVVAESLYDLAFSRDENARFVLAHELGHVLLHDSERLEHCGIDQIDKAQRSNFELEANLFAEAFLMPAHLVRSMTATEISHSCGVSIVRAEERLARLKGEMLCKYISSFCEADAVANKAS